MADFGRVPWNGLFTRFLRVCVCVRQESRRYAMGCQPLCLRRRLQLLRIVNLSVQKILSATFTLWAQCKLFIVNLSQALISYALSSNAFLLVRCSVWPLYPSVRARRWSRMRVDSLNPCMWVTQQPKHQVSPLLAPKRHLNSTCLKMNSKLVTRMHTKLKVWSSNYNLANELFGWRRHVYWMTTLVLPESQYQFECPVSASGHVFSAPQPQSRLGQGSYTHGTARGMTRAGRGFLHSYRSPGGFRGTFHLLFHSLWFTLSPLDLPWRHGTYNLIGNVMVSKLFLHKVLHFSYFFFGMIRGGLGTQSAIFIVCSLA